MPFPPHITTAGIPDSREEVALIINSIQLGTGYGVATDLERLTVKGWIIHHKNGATQTFARLYPAQSHALVSLQVLLGQACFTTAPEACKPKPHDTRNQSTRSRKGWREVGSQVSRSVSRSAGWCRILQPLSVKHGSVKRVTAFQQFVIRNNLLRYFLDIYKYRLR